MIKFSKYIWLYFFISALVILPGIYSLVRYGFRPSIDFIGGTLLEIQTPPTVTKEIVSTAAEAVSLPVVSIQQTQSQSYILRLKPEAAQKTQELLASLTTEASATAQVLRIETVGPTLGGELLRKALIAATIAIVCILLYIAYAFKNVTYGVSAIVALIHDLLVVAGIFSLLGHFYGVEVDTLFVTALLTTMSFSVHDTIVVFDRIREMLKKGEKGTVAELADRALTQTMSRSLANSVTIIIMLLALVLLGGESIRYFAIALLIGTVSGTYSSPFIATPVFILLRKLQKK